MSDSGPPRSALCADLIDYGTRTHAARRALAFEGQSRTVAQVDALANQLARALMAHGLKRGDSVAILLNNSLHSMPLEFACIRAGLNRVPLNSRLSLAEHRAMLAETGARVLVHGADLLERAKALQTGAKRLRCLGLGAALAPEDELLGLAQTLSPEAPGVPLAADDVILTIFTSGTTGTLKAAQHTQASSAAMCFNVLDNLVKVRPGDVMLHAASLIHASGLFVLPFWISGGCTLIMRAFEPAEYLRLIESEGVTAINLVPTMLHMLMQQEGFARTDVSRLRQVIYGASPMPLPVLKRAMALWGQERFWQYYGQTEAPLCISVLRPEDHAGARLASCGRPARGVQVRLVDEEGRDVPRGEAGEIAVRSPTRMRGYLNAPELNAQTLMAEGWLRTRDQGRFDEDGFLYLLDRTSDMIITGGYNVYPREIEDIVLEHPGVLECAVIGLPHRKWVEAVTVVLVPKPGASVTDEEILALLRGRLASYKKPRRIIRVGAIPKTAVGKPMRKALRAQILAGRDC